MKAIRPHLLALLLTLPVAANAQDTFHGCGMEGKTKQTWIKAQNGLKNRYTPPAASDIDGSVSLKDMLKLGDDLERFDDSKGAEIVGYVRLVKPGGLETCHPITSLTVLAGPP